MCFITPGLPYSIASDLEYIDYMVEQTACKEDKEIIVFC